MPREGFMRIWATSRSVSSPTACPRSSLTALKPSRSSRTTDTGWLNRREREPRVRPAEVPDEVGAGDNADHGDGPERLRPAEHQRIPGRPRRQHEGAHDVGEDAQRDRRGEGQRDDELLAQASARDDEILGAVTRHGDPLFLLPPLTVNVRIFNGLCGSSLIRNWTVWGCFAPCPSSRPGTR